MISESQRALTAVEVYIKPKLPSTVTLHAFGTCSRSDAIQVMHERMWALLYGPTLMPHD
jgi:hypothetical protein